MLFPDGLDQVPRLSGLRTQAYVLNELALSIRNQPGRAAMLYRRCMDIYEKEGDQEYVSIGLCNLSNVLRLSGVLRQSETAARRALLIARQFRAQNHEAIALYELGLTLAVQGIKADSSEALDRSFSL